MRSLLELELSGLIFNRKDNAADLAAVMCVQRMTSLQRLCISEEIRLTVRHIKQLASWLRQLRILRLVLERVHLDDVIAICASTNTSEFPRLELVHLHLPSWEDVDAKEQAISRNARVVKRAKAANENVAALAHIRQQTRTTHAKRVRIKVFWTVTHQPDCVVHPDGSHPCDSAVAAPEGCLCWSLVHGHYPALSVIVE